MKKIAWVTDSTVHITDKLAQNEDVYVIPLTLIFGEEQYEDGITITPQELYTKMNESPISPTTSQPSIGTFVSLYEELKGKYEKVIMVHVSGELSGTLSCSKQAADIVGLDYTAIDSKSLSYGITYLLEKGIELQEADKSVEEITAYIERVIPTLENYILIGNLKQLHKSGRMNGAQFFLGTMLSIKPIIQISNGVINIIEKVRTEKRALLEMVQRSSTSIKENNVRKVAILHGNREEEAKQWKEKLLEENPSLHIEIAPISSTISVHAGEGTLAFLWYNTLE
jgi:DegV family protein with EDD domain